MNEADVSRNWSKREAELLRKKEATQERIRTYRKRADEAEALADDLENQNAELCMGLDDAQGRIAELETLIVKLAPVFEQIMAKDLDWKFDYYGDPLADIEQALTGDGSRIMDVVKAARTLMGEDESPDNVEMLIEALDQLGSAEGG